MWQILKKTAVVVLAVLFIFFLALMAWIYYTPTSDEISEYARTEWSKSFIKVGLADVPKGATYAGGTWTEDRYGTWAFRADDSIMRRWLSNSNAIRSAEVRTKPGKQAYLIYIPKVNKVCLVVVKESKDIAYVRVQIIDLASKKGTTSRKWYDGKDAHNVLSELLENNALWGM